MGVVDEAGFEHHLWRDYLVARALSLDPGCWTEEVFDVASTFATSVECLTMAVEQIKEVPEKVAFVNAVYDWNYVAALECIAKSGEGEEAERRVPEEIREAILAAFAEKRFDAVERTRSHPGGLGPIPVRKAVPLPRDAHCNGRAHAHLEMEGDLGVWRRLFCQPPGTPVTNEDIELIASPNSLVGWAAANFVRRGTLYPDDEERVRAIYRSQQGKVGKRSIRWRVIHTLGAPPATAIWLCSRRRSRRMSTDGFCMGRLDPSSK